MFGMGGWEIALIVVIALLILGPKKLPELARGLGKSIREFRAATSDFRETVESEINEPKAPGKEAQYAAIEAPSVKPVEATPAAQPAVQPAAAPAADPKTDA